MKVSKTVLDANTADLRNFKLTYKGLDISGITYSVGIITYDKKTRALLRYIKTDVSK